ncbi:MAG: hypothetical protein A4S14_02915 [Proteobacteria bacterium SG_bin9]|nr:MAG: hypothetical protein A4S14_02915 [Proteobacteria bacterium SG_bin9]
MNIDLARHMVRTSFHVCRELQDLQGFLKNHCDASEYKDHAAGIARAIDAVQASLLSKAITAYPELAMEIDAAISRYGRYP